MQVPSRSVLPAAVVVALVAVGAWADTPSGSSASAPATVDDGASSTVSASSTAPTTTAPPTTTSCASVVHIGDSTSIGLMSESYIADPNLRIDAQYRRVGVGDVRLEISGARSVVERYRAPNADEIASALKTSGYEGCWVVALGVTDAANVAAGSPVSHTERIDRMMAVIGDDPVLWPTVKTLEPEGAWSGPNMLPWNEALLAALGRYPNIALYDWAAIVRDGWFEPDGIHYTSAGNIERARLIADALVAAYPASSGREALGPERSATDLAGVVPQ